MADTAQDHRDGSEGWQEQEGCASEGRAEPQAGARRVLLGVKVCLSFGGEVATLPLLHPPCNKPVGMENAV